MQRVLLLLITLFSLEAVKSNLDQYTLFRKANRQAQAGQYTTAVKQYRQLLDRYPAGLLRCEASFNLACAEYGMKHYRRAAEQFAALPPGNSDLSRTAGYNQGNALVLEAFRSHKGANQQELLARALSCYRRSLLENPQNADARINYEIVLRAMQRRQPPPPSPAPQGGGSPDGKGQDGGGAVSQLILENARQEEARQLRKYFKPLPTKPAEQNQPDW
jgi:tetratricopeptide (TPR) repeat protein